MSKITYKSINGILTYSGGLMATLLCNTSFDELSTIIPERNYKYSVEKSIISGPQINENYESISAYTELEKIIWDVLAILTKKPTQLDLEMLSTMDDNIWELF